MNLLPRRKKRTGLALGGGAARGMAHIGVLKVLEAEGIEVDVLSGTSIGAFIGALYAAGVPVAQMEEVARNVDWRQMARLLDPTIPTAGLIDGRKVARFMSELLPVRTFEELEIPLAVVATDVETGESLVIKQGNLLEALQASIAFPGIFTPVRFGDRFLVDGGLCKPVPVDVARGLGAEFVIGVCAIPEVNKAQEETFLPPAETPSPARGRFLDLFNSQGVERIMHDLWRLNGREPRLEDRTTARRRRAPGIFRVCAQSVAIMENEINALRLEREQIDLLIRPALNGINLLDFHRADEAIQAGEEATRAQLEKLRR